VETCSSAAPPDLLGGGQPSANQLLHPQHQPLADRELKLTLGQKSCRKRGCIITLSTLQCPAPLALQFMMPPCSHEVKQSGVCRRLALLVPFHAWTKQTELEDPLKACISRQYENGEQKAYFPRAQLMFHCVTALAAKSLDPLRLKRN